ncbi:MAG: hypothetical protein V1944_01170, partial [Candidatus Aenigmatarchaeota archaeon]
EFGENCVQYSIYNPFDTEVTAKLTVERGLQPFISKIDPIEFKIPAYTGNSTDNAAKLANKQDVLVCFKSSLARWPPFYPVSIKGVVLASAGVGEITGSGSSSSSVVQAPLTLNIGSLTVFYEFSIALVLIIGAIVFLVLKSLKKLPKRVKKFCSHCQKWFPGKMKHCPDCGSALK